MVTGVSTPLVAVFLLAGTANAASAACATAGDAAAEASCSSLDAPSARAGQAMIQTFTDKGASNRDGQEVADSQKKAAGKIGPLNLRLSSLGTEITSLEERLS